MGRGRLEEFFHRGKGFDMSGDPALSNRASIRCLLSILQQLERLIARALSIRRPPHLATPPMLLLELQVPFVLGGPSVLEAPQRQ